MYFIEKFVKLYFKLTKKKSDISVTEYADNSELEDFVTCKHNFMPIDSTGEILACSKCGYVINKNKVK